MQLSITTHLCRLKKGKELRKAEDLKEVEQNMHVIRAPAGNVFTLLSLHFDAHELCYV